MAKHWSDMLSCHLCNKRFRSMSAEAYHRHNAQFVCKGYPPDKVRIPTTQTTEANNDE